jgi:hypothetical protein
VKYFLICFNRPLGQVVGDIVEFDDADEAVRARFHWEELVDDNPNIEVVVLGASDRESLAKTHSRYFGGPDLDELTTVAG